MKDRFDCPLVLTCPYCQARATMNLVGTKRGNRRERSRGLEQYGAPTRISKGGNDKPLPTPVTVYPSDLKTDEDYARAKALSESAPDEPLVYDLFAVVLHHGNSANSGHYTSYIRDTLGEGTWTPPEFKPKRASASGAKHSAGHTNDFEMRKFGPDAPLRLLVTILVTGKRDPRRNQLFTYDFGNQGLKLKRPKGKKGTEVPQKAGPP